MTNPLSHITIIAIICDEAPCPADANGDGSVNVTDLLMVISDWGLSNSPADVNVDGVVDVADMLQMISAWGACQ